MDLAALLLYASLLSQQCATKEPAVLKYSIERPERGFTPASSELNPGGTILYIARLRPGESVAIVPQFTGDGVKLSATGKYAALAEGHDISAEAVLKAGGKMELHYTQVVSRAGKSCAQRSFDVWVSLAK